MDCSIGVGLLIFCTAFDAHGWLAALWQPLQRMGTGGAAGSHLQLTWLFPLFALGMRRGGSPCLPLWYTSMAAVVSCQPCLQREVVLGASCVAAWSSAVPLMAHVGVGSAQQPPPLDLLGQRTTAATAACAWLDS
jgi:hypothetical protein